MQNIRHITDSIKGTRHAENEDFVLIIDNNVFSLYVIFDGVSTAEHATDGIRIATKYINDNFDRFIIDNELKLQELMFEANKKIVDENIEDAFTTFAALALNKLSGQIFISGLGDSRIYGISKQYIIQYSKDDKNVFSESITKCLGMKDLSIVDFNVNEIKKPDQTILLCTDGFYSFLESNKLEFFDILNFSNLSNTKKRLKKDIENKNTDDASYIILNTHV